MSRRIALPIADIMRAYEEGSSAQELATHYGVGRVTILNRLREWDVEVRPTGVHRLGKHHTEETKQRISETLRGGPWETETGNRGESNPGKVSAESNPGVSESPPARHLTEKRRLSLELEGKIETVDVNLRRTRALKYEHEQELARLKGLPEVR